ncbi:PucR family transcriptional regulator [Paenibacillus albiflavus]|uniref:PucR family transcriptional regulator n=1 Tax=Paenibacillus albiflavus TaxID=2545760 RepID=A0A4R4E1Z6_9BACL|nr:helix-turn-helix domain-containing protein [Paenibacillus albiflavus]TCZ72867.1 PucR family transcriptional regulator [Paenibacillus albiflavus]
MIWEEWKNRVAAILHTPVSLRTITIEQWLKLVKQVGANPDACQSVRQDHEMLFYLNAVAEDEILILAVNSSELSESERHLIELSIEPNAYLLNDTRQIVAEESNAAVQQFRDWLLEQLKLGSANKLVPDSLTIAPLLEVGVIPLLLSTDKSLEEAIPYDAFKKLLKHFFEKEVMLIPLEEKEWLIFATEELLSPAGIEENGTIEEQLDAIAMGLHEMLAAEWALESHISIFTPIIPAKEIVTTVHRLREAIHVGRLFSLNSNVHLPWKLHLETLLYSVPDDRKASYLRQLISGAEGTIDVEMQTTLTRFFELDCNVSDTAKQLFIHRNTLLYRLDKLKQETGFDVRSFHDAVLVRIALELYKVTKRKH